MRHLEGLKSCWLLLNVKYPEILEKKNCWFPRNFGKLVF